MSNSWEVNSYADTPISFSIAIQDNHQNKDTQKLPLKKQYTKTDINSTLHCSGLDWTGRKNESSQVKIGRLKLVHTGVHHKCGEESSETLSLSDFRARQQTALAVSDVPICKIKSRMLVKKFLLVSDKLFTNPFR